MDALEFVASKASFSLTLPHSFSLPICRSHTQGTARTHNRSASSTPSRPRSPQRPLSRKPFEGLHIPCQTSGRRLQGWDSRPRLTKYGRAKPTHCQVILIIRIWERNFSNAYNQMFPSLFRSFSRCLSSSFSFSSIHSLFLFRVSSYNDRFSLVMIFYLHIFHDF